METGLFTKDGVELANNTKQITAETYVMGVNSPDDGTIEAGVEVEHIQIRLYQMMKQMQTTLI